MNRVEDFIGTILESRFRLDLAVSDAPDSCVFRGLDLQSGAPVVIRMARALRGMSEEELAGAFGAFAVEAEQLARLSRASSHVEQLLAYGRADGSDEERFAYCVFADIEGVPLSRSLPPNGLPLARAIAMLQPVAAALGTAHELGVFHGDVRPENMIVVDDAGHPTIKLVHFTRASRLGDDSRTFSASYGAPEHFRRASGGSSIGPPTDTYGLALCLVELVTGQPPLIGSTPNELYKQTTDIERRPTLRGRGAPVSQGIDAVIARAVEINPTLRWPTTRAFWSALVAHSGTMSRTEPIAFSVLGTPISSASILSATPIDTDALAERAGVSRGPPPLPTRAPLNLLEPSPPASPLSPIAPEAQPPADAPGRRGRMRVVAMTGVAVLGVGGALIASGFGRTPVSSGPPEAGTASVVGARVASASASAGSGSDRHGTNQAPITSASATAPVIVRAQIPPGMIRIPAGTFTMGKDTEGRGERPAHRVVLTHGFYLDRTEVTIDAYTECVEQGSCAARNVHLRKTVAGSWGCNLDKEHGAHPANCVDRNQAIAYCAFAKKRLPTEAEWEYAARGPDERDYPWGNSEPTLCSFAVLSGMKGECGDLRGTSPVGSAPDGASPFGVLDMGGNVWEWVADDYVPYPSGEITDPAVTITDAPESAPARGILRGGAWDFGPQSAKTSYRRPAIPEMGHANMGIRCARSE